MLDNSAQIIDTLNKAGIRLSHQRIEIMRYIVEHCTHPTVDDIYKALHPSQPTLSRTTVYNTLRLLVENGAVNALEIEPGCTHYDADTSPHAHFYCRNCRRIYDVPMPADPSSIPYGFATDSINVSYNGLCPECMPHSQEILTNQ